MYSLDDLDKINNEIRPLKATADREQVSIRGLSGLLYTPHIDIYNEVCIKRAAIMLFLKKKGEIPFTDVEIISDKLSFLYPRAKSNAVVELDGQSYTRRFAPLKLSKSGKSVRKWGKFWLRRLPNGKVDHAWESQVREIWPENFLINMTDI